MRDGGEDGLIRGLQPFQSSRFPRSMLLLFRRSSLQAILPELTNLMETRAYFAVYIDDVLAVKNGYLQAMYVEHNPWRWLNLIHTII